MATVSVETSAQIRALLAFHEIPKSKLAPFVGISVPYFSRLIKGDRQLSPDFIDQVVRAVNVYIQQRTEAETINQ